MGDSSGASSTPAVGKPRRSRGGARSRHPTLLIRLQFTATFVIRPSPSFPMQRRTLRPLVHPLRRVLAPLARRRAKGGGPPTYCQLVFYCTTTMGQSSGPSRASENSHRAPGTVGPSLRAPISPSCTPEPIRNSPIHGVGGQRTGTGIKWTAGTPRRADGFRSLSANCRRFPGAAGKPSPRGSPLRCRRVRTVGLA
jgi:hypothetical protein